MNQLSIENKIEAVLFYKNGPVEIKKLAKILEVGERETREALGNLKNSLEGRGICLVETDKEASLATAPGLTGLIDQMAKDEMSGEIGKAGLETLAIILYNGPVSRREIDYIRGVNSTFILRNLCIRGLVEKEQDREDLRVYKYRGSLPLLAHLGIKSAQELPEFDELKSRLNE